MGSRRRGDETRAPRRASVAGALALAVLVASWLGTPLRAGVPSGAWVTGVAEAAGLPGVAEPPTEARAAGSSDLAASRSRSSRAEPAECAATPEHPCPLGVDAPATAALAGPGDVHAYRFFALDMGARARVALSDAPGGTRLRLLDWGARPLAEATVVDGEPLHLDAEPREAGAYLVEVTAGEETADTPYALSLHLEYTGPTPRAVALAPPTVESNAPARDVEGRYILKTPRGGSPEAGLALARSLRTSPETDLADFALVADVRFEQADGPAAATVRFRYQPEAGGGTGYLLSVDPFNGEVSLSTFDEGQRRLLVPPRMHPLAKVEHGTMRLAIRATGPNLSVSIDGQEVLSLVDDRYNSGLVALGVVTWSGPVMATFDNVLVTVTE